MDDWNNEHSMVFRCGAARKESMTRRRGSRGVIRLKRFRDAPIRDAWRGPRIIAGGRRKRAVAGRGTAEASEAKILAKHCRALSSKCARGQSGDFLAFRTYNWDFGSPRAKRPQKRAPTDWCRSREPIIHSGSSPYVLAGKILSQE